MTANYACLKVAVLRKRHVPVVAEAIRCCGSIREFVANLHLPYLVAVERWMARKNRRLRISTYIFHCVPWGAAAMIGQFSLIRTSCRPVGETALRRWQLARRRHTNFRGREGRCNDDSLLVDSGCIRVDEIEEAAHKWKSMLPRLKRRHVLAMQLRFLEGMTLMECGKALGVTKERFRQILWRATHEAAKIG